jgi:predicted nuclease of predicted toxin-antitoxin system
MRFLIDEDLPRSAAGLLRQFGHEAIEVRDSSLRGMGDADIALYAERHGLCLLTCDSDFGDIRNYPPARYSGIIVLRLPAKANSSVIIDLLKRLLAHPHILHKLSGKLAIVGESRIRIRKG